MADPKARPHHREYIEVLRQMGPGARLAKAFELSALGRQVFLEGLRARHPDMPEAEFRSLVLARYARCHDRPC